MKPLGAAHRRVALNASVGVGCRMEARFQPLHIPQQADAVPLRDKPLPPAKVVAGFLRDDDGTIVKGAGRISVDGDQVAEVLQKGTSVADNVGRPLQGAYERLKLAERASVADAPVTEQGEDGSEPAGIEADGHSGGIDADVKVCKGCSRTLGFVGSIGRTENSHGSSVPK